MKKNNIIVEAKNIYKTFESVTVLKNISINFENNKIYGLFGRNGAGKTTFLDILMSRKFADSGSVNIFGKDSLKFPGNIEKSCYMPEKHYFPSRLKIKNLLDMGKIHFPNYDEQYASKLCNLFNLNINKKYAQLSRGHQSIFRIVLGMASKTAITIFDEPVLGLDAVSRDRFYSELIEEFSRNPRLFIIATHFIEESADLFNEAIIIDNGKVVKQAPVEELLSNVFYVSGKKSIIDNFIKNKKVINRQTVNDFTTAVVEGKIYNEKKINGLTFSNLTIQKLFIHLTNESNGQEK